MSHTETTEAVERLTQQYTTKFWKKYDTKSKPRVIRGMERISKDVVDDFWIMLKEALTTIRKETLEEVERADCLKLSYVRDMKSTNQNEIRQAMLDHLQALKK